MSPTDIPRIDWDGARISPERWGRDHWQVFTYLGHCFHKSDGVPDRDKMRCKPGNPLIGFRVVRIQGDREYPTKLVDGGFLWGHDDYDCADDLIAAGLMTSLGTGANPRYGLTPVGVLAWSYCCDRYRSLGGLTWEKVLAAVRGGRREIQAFLQEGES